MELDTLPSAHSSERLLSSKYSWQQWLALLMMLIAIIAVYLPRMTQWGVAPQDFPADTFVYHTDLDFWTQTNRARSVTSLAPFDLEHDLAKLPLQVGDWHGIEKQETNEEVIILLDPEQYVLRLYQNSLGQYIWLSLIGARSSQAFHPPDVCYDADGWQYNMNSHATMLADESEIYGLYLDAEKEIAGQVAPVNHVVYYFYLFPNATRDLSEGIVLFKLTSARYGSVEDTLQIQDDFVRQFFLTTKEQ